MAITIETIATNRYAPSGSEGIHLYSTGLDGGSNLTLGQLVIAVSLRSAAAYEAESVIKMNAMAGGSAKLDQASTYMADIADNNVLNWSAVKASLTDTLGIDESSLPDSLDTYAKRMTAIAAVKAKVDALTQQQQQQMIDLQTLVNRRDVAYSASTNIVKALGMSQSSGAQNF